MVVYPSMVSTFHTPVSLHCSLAKQCFFDFIWRQSCKDFNKTQTETLYPLLVSAKNRQHISLLRLTLYKLRHMLVDLSYFSVIYPLCKHGFLSIHILLVTVRTAWITLLFHCLLPIHLWIHDTTSLPAAVEDELKHPSKHPELSKGIRVRSASRPISVPFSLEGMLLSPHNSLILQFPVLNIC